MSLDLDLLPFESDGPGGAYAMSVLRCKLATVLQDVLADLPEKRPVPDDFKSYRSHEGDFGITKRDAYEAVMQCLPAQVLLRIREHEAVRGNAWNRAVWAYLAALPPETPIALYWS